MKEESTRSGLYREELPRLKAAPMDKSAKFPPELHPESISRRCRHLAVNEQDSKGPRMRIYAVREFGWYRGDNTFVPFWGEGFLLC